MWKRSNKWICETPQVLSDNAHPLIPNQTQTQKYDSFISISDARENSIKKSAEDLLRSGSRKRRARRVSVADCLDDDVTSGRARAPSIRPRQSEHQAPEIS